MIKFNHDNGTLYIIEPFKVESVNTEGKVVYVNFTSGRYEELSLQNDSDDGFKRKVRALVKELVRVVSLNIFYEFRDEDVQDTETSVAE